VAGPDGNLWFIENSANKIGMIDPTTHAMSEFPIPTANSNPWGITAGPDGNIWFTERNASKIGMINLATDKITEFSTPTKQSSPVGITAGPDNTVWFIEANGAFQIGMINMTTHKITEYPVPNSFNAHPFWITEGPDGNLWSTFGASSWIAKFDPTTDAVTGFRAPGTSSGYADVYHITAGPDGNVWFTDYNGNAVGMINTTTDAISEFSVPTPSSNVYGITTGPDGDLWFTETAANQIGRINPTTDAINEFPVPNPDSVNQITSGPDGNLWFTDISTSAIGVATLASTQFMVTQQPPASITAGNLFGLTVEDVDSSGNLITSFDGTVTVALASNPGGATLGGTLSLQASGGVATFSGLTLNKAASGYTLMVSSSGIGEGVTSAMTVTPAAASQVVITQQPPATVGVNSAFGLQASIEDPYGNVVTTASNTVSVAFANNPTGATLGGTLSVTASQGVATFSNLTINKTGSGNTLQVSSSGLSSAVTNVITVTKKAGAAIVSNNNVASPSDLVLGALVPDSPDLFAGLGLKKRFS